MGEAATPARYLNALAPTSQQGSRAGATKSTSSQPVARPLGKHPHGTIRVALCHSWMAPPTPAPILAADILLPKGSGHTYLRTAKSKSLPLGISHLPLSISPFLLGLCWGKRYYFLPIHVNSLGILLSHWFFSRAVTSATTVVVQNVSNTWQHRA